MAVTILNDWAVGPLDNSDFNFTISAGTNRLLVVAVTGEGTAGSFTIDSADFGDQSMTAVDAGIVNTDGSQISARLFFLNEAGIAAAVGSSISTSFTDLVDDDAHRAVICFEGVDQASPIFDNDTAETSSPPLTAFTLTTDADSFAFAISGINRIRAFSWAADLIEQTETTGASSTGSVAEVATTGASVSVAPTPTDPGRVVVAAASLRAATGAVVNLAAVDPSISGSTSDLSVIPGLSGSAAAVSGSAADLERIINASGVAASVSGSAAVIARTRFIALSAALGLDASGSILRLNLVDGSASMVLGGVAGVAGFLGAQSTANLALSASATTFVPPPPPPPTALADSFQQFQRPAILIDLGFDEGEVNIWTRPVQGFFNGKLYQPLAGITSGISVRNSLDNRSLDVSVTLSGQSQELLNIALTSNFQGRPVTVTLANLDENFAVFSSEVIMLGTIANMPIADSEDESTVSVEVDSVFRSLFRPRPFRLSAADQSLIDPNDSFFDFVSTDDVSTPRFGGT